MVQSRLNWVDCNQPLHFEFLVSHVTLLIDSGWTMTNHDPHEKLEKKQEQSSVTAPKDTAITTRADSDKVVEEQQSISKNRDKTPSGIEKAVHESFGIIGAIADKPPTEKKHAADSHSIEKLAALGTPESEQFAEMRREIRRKMPPGEERDKLEKVTKTAIAEVLKAGQHAHIPSEQHDGGIHQALGFHITRKGELPPPPKPTITVQNHDTLSTIASFVLGRNAPKAEIDSYTQQIAKLNHIKDPAAKLHSGDKLELPPTSGIGDKSEHKSEKSESAPPVTDVEQQRITLLKLAAEKGLNLADNIRKIESMHSPQESSETFRNVNRILMDKSGKTLTLEQKKHIAEQVIDQAAHPTEIDQGYHNTCNVTTIESRTYTRTPSIAAKLVADVIVDGQFVSPHGVTVKLTPRTYDDESILPHDSARSHASEIFQRTAINLHWKLAGRYNGHDIRYEQVKAPGGDDTGERLLDGTLKGKVLEKSPNLDDHVLCEISNLVTGKSEKGIILCNERNLCGKDTPEITKIRSENDLADAIKRLKAENKLPVILRVDCTSEPFFSDSRGGAAGGSSGAHVVTVRDISGSPPRIMVDNQWGEKYDHIKDGGIPVHDLYLATLAPADAAVELRKDVMNNRRSGHVDSHKEFDLIRMEYAGQIIPDEATLETRLSALMKSQKEVWNQQDKAGKLNQQDKDKSIEVVDKLIEGGFSSWSGKGRMRTLQSSLGEISHEDCDNRLTQYAKELAKDPKPSKNDVHAFKDLLKTLPKTRSSKILKESHLH